MFYHFSIYEYLYLFSQKSKDEVIFNRRRVDVGTIMNDSLLKCSFKFTNVSSHDIKVNKIYRSCNCTKVFVTDSLLRIGESSYIYMIVDTSSKNGHFEVASVIQLNTLQENYALKVVGNKKD
ncbi:DUF1573 domain-containing protein [Bacteroides fragilis]